MSLKGYFFVSLHFLENGGQNQIAIFPLHYKIMGWEGMQLDADTSNLSDCNLVKGSLSRSKTTKDISLSAFVVVVVFVLCYI